MKRDTEKLNEIKDWVGNWLIKRHPNNPLAHVLKRMIVEDKEANLISDMIYDYELAIRNMYIDELMTPVLLIEGIKWDDKEQMLSQLKVLRSTLSNTVLDIAKAQTPGN